MTQSLGYELYALHLESLYVRLAGMQKHCSPFWYLKRPGSMKQLWQVSAPAAAGNCRKSLLAI